MSHPTRNQACCPEFKPDDWDKKTLSWNGKRFIRDSVPELFHLPFPPMIKKKIERMWKAIEQAGAASPNKEDTLVLFHDPTPFKGEIYISVEKDVPTEKNVELSGNFVCGVFDGGYNAVPKFVRVMDAYLGETGKKAKDYYVHYAYCPKCARKFRHNYMILFAQI